MGSYLGSCRLATASDGPRCRTGQVGRRRECASGPSAVGQNQRTSFAVVAEVNCILNIRSSNVTSEPLLQRIRTCLSFSFRTSIPELPIQACVVSFSSLQQFHTSRSSGFRVLHNNSTTEGDVSDQRTTSDSFSVPTTIVPLFTFSRMPWTVALVLRHQVNRICSSGCTFRRKIPWMGRPPTSTGAPFASARRSDKFISTPACGRGLQQRDPVANRAQTAVRRHGTGSDRSSTPSILSHPSRGCTAVSPTPASFVRRSSHPVSRLHLRRWLCSSRTCSAPCSVPGLVRSASWSIHRRRAARLRAGRSPRPQPQILPHLPQGRKLQAAHSRREQSSLKSEDPPPTRQLSPQPVDAQTKWRSAVLPGVRQGPTQHPG